MRLDPLLATTAAEIPGDVADALATAAANFVAAGGTVTLTEWTGLAPESRAALVAAQNARAADLARAFAVSVLRAQMDPRAALGGGS